jgi:two-component system KDP operon response regulator KdpE
MAEKLLVVEDDTVFSNVLWFILTKSGFQVEVANTGKSGLQKAYTCNPDAVILDIMLPDLDGWQICTRLRDMSDVPIIMLTAFGAEEDLIKGLNLGADEYIIKPVTTQELLARVRAVLRRKPRLSSDDLRSEGDIFTYDKLVVDFGRHRVMVDGKRIHLSPTEFRLLSVLILRQQQMLSYEFLLEEVWGSEYRGEIDYLRLCINHLQRKIEKDPTKPVLIQNEFSTGYQFG